MLEKRTKIFILILLILTLLVSWRLITSENPRIVFPKTQNKNGQLPARKVWVTLAQNQHDQFFEQLRKFADRNAFRIRISQTDPSGENFLVQMWSDDIEIDGVDSSDPGLFKIGFYNANEDRPVSTQVFDELIVDLKGFIEEIPNIEFRYVLDPIP